MVSGGPRYDVPKAAPPPLRLVQLFVNTVNREHELEWLPDPPALEQWLRDHELQPGALTDDDLLAAHKIREALRSLLIANGGGANNGAGIDAINRAASAAILTARLDSDGRLTFTALAPGIDGLLGSILAIVFSSMVDGTWTRLKACPNCRWSFYDYSRNRSARWCSMTLCGNRIKTQSYRRRTRRL